MKIPLKFVNEKQEQFVSLPQKYSCFSGGYGNGKSYAASMKALLLMGTFPKYRFVFARQSVTDLKRSTMSTFFKVCPPELYEESKGGKRADSLNYLRLINGSEIFWMHLEDADEKVVRGLETNGVVIDQAEEISENMFIHLSSRAGRWDQVEIPLELADKLPRNEDGKPEAPSYVMILCNPDHELHWIYRRFHPDSMEFQQKYCKNHIMIQASSTENRLLPKDIIDDMMANDPAWVKRFVFGEWGIPGGNIHYVHSDSVLRPGINCDTKFLDNAIRSGRIYRILDHGDSAPTCCLWAVAYKEWFFFFREYYKPEGLISEHRQIIHDFSKFDDGTPMHISNSWADPSIFRKNSQKNGGYWSVADEYLDKNLRAPSLSWNPADNNEQSTRNRINEYLKKSSGIKHPITQLEPAPRMYFIERNALWSQGLQHGISQIKSQKRKLLGTDGGKPIYDEERDAAVPDHAYDCIRYFSAMHPFSPKQVSVRAPAGSFSAVRKEYIKLKKSGHFEREAERMGYYQ